MSAPKINTALLTGFGDGVAWEKLMNDLLAEAYTGDSQQFLDDLASDLGDIKTAFNDLIDWLQTVDGTNIKVENVSDDLKIGDLELESEE